MPVGDSVSEPPLIGTLPLRPQPRVLRIETPPIHVLSLGVTLFVLISLVFVGVIFAIGAGAVVPSILVWGLAAAFLLWSFQSTKRINEKRRHYLGELNAAGHDPFAVAIARKWASLRRQPKPNEVSAVLETVAELRPPGGLIVCLGEIDIPTVGALVFEPEIITPAQLVGRRLIFIPMAAVLLTVWLLQIGHVIPHKFFDLGSFTYVLVIAAIAGVTWVWRGAIRPTYVRMAPGIVQVMEFRYRRQRPLIRSYPLDAQTVVVIHPRKRRREIWPGRVVLLRGARQDELTLDSLSGRARTIERLWQALLSTAPTPPLSEDELVG